MIRTLHLVDPNTGEQIGYVPADPEGTGENVEYEVNLPMPLLPGTTVEGYQVDQDGRRGESEFVVVDEEDFEDEIEEATSAEPPVIDPVTAGDTVFTGEYAPSGPVYIVDGDGEVVGFIPGDPSIEPSTRVPFEILISRNLNPGETLRAYTTDEFGNPSEEMTITVGTPAFNLGQVTVNPIDSNDTVITGTYDPPAPLYVVIDGEVIELIPADPSATPGSSVSFEVAVPGDTPLAPGSVVSFYQEDPYGRPSQPVYVRVDAADTDPEEPFEIAPPVINPITSEDTTITGTKRDDTDLVLVDPNTGQQIGHVPGDPAGTGENVDFEVELPEPLAPGTVVEGYEVDQDGRRGESSFVVVDEADFEDDIDEAIENPVPAPSVNPITGADQTITGTRDPSRPIYLVVDGQVVGYLPGDPTAEPGSSLPFEVPLQVPLTPGTVVDAYQVDEFGNPGEVTQVTVQVPAPGVYPITDEDEVIIFDRDPNYPVVVIVDGKEVVRVPAEPGGDRVIEIPIDPLPAGSEVEVRQEDDNGNPGESTTVTVEPAPNEDPGETPGEPEQDDDEPVEEGSDTIVVIVNPRDTTVVVVDGEIVAIIPGDPDADPNDRIRLEIELDEALREGQEVEIYQVTEDGVRGPSLTFTVPEEVEAGEEPIGERLPITATDVWSIGLTGLIAMITGIGAKLFGRKKEDDEE